VSERFSIKEIDPLWRRFDSIVERLITWAARLGGILLLAVGFFVFYEVVCRHIFQSPTLWVMDYSIYLVMWAVLLGSAYTMRTHGLVLVDVLINRISPGIRRIIQIGIHITILAFALTITAAGAYSCIRAYQMKELTMSALYIPLYYPMSSIPIGFALIVLEEISTISKLVFLESGAVGQKGKALS
jgi:TRAP-type C4-dicarboxylate transport system permease small subunit